MEICSRPQLLIVHNGVTFCFSCWGGFNGVEVVTPFNFSHRIFLSLLGKLELACTVHHGASDACSPLNLLPLESAPTVHIAYVICLSSMHRSSSDTEQNECITQSEIRFIQIVSCILNIILIWVFKDLERALRIFHPHGTAFPVKCGWNKSFSVICIAESAKSTLFFLDNQIGK